MAELELSVKYKPPQLQALFLLICVTFPFWFLLGPGILAVIIMYYTIGPFSYEAGPTILWALLTLLCLIPFTFVSAISEDDLIRVSKEGVSFPLFLLGRVKFKRNRSWSELARVDLTSPDRSEGKLLLHFCTGEMVPVSLKYVSPSDLEQFLLSIELWGKNCERSPALIAYHNQLQNENVGIGRVGYTQLWEEELSRRFSATTFVPLEPETKLQRGSLRVIKQLAFGGLSAIYLAQRNEQDLVVLKEAVVPANSDESARRKAEEYVQRESELLASLSHPQIARVLDHFVEDTRHYLVLEYIHGQDLRQYVSQNGAQSIDQVIAWGRQIADIVDFLHTQIPPIIHRDLTPDNLVVKNDGTIVLIDFGAANEFVGTATGTLVGKQAYMAPEQLRGKAVPQSDLYALGGTLYFLLTGNDPRPLAESSVKKFLADVPDELDQLIKECTHFDTQKRLQSASEIRTRLERLSTISLREKPEYVAESL
ncbi:MAG TPA: serine/threonine-protein kinase [Candidatus Obscuribacterales bacterium]